MQRVSASQTGGDAPRGIRRAMRGLQGFASQATAAYGKLNDRLTELIPTVASMGSAFGSLRAELRSLVPWIDSSVSSFHKMRTAIGTTIPLVGVLSAQLAKLGIVAKGSSMTAASGMTSLAASAGRAAATVGAANAGLLATLGPFALIAAAAGAAYVAMFKWDKVPLLLKPILLIMSPLVFAIRAVATAWNVATAPFRAFSAAVGLATSAVTGLVKGLLSLPGLLVSATIAAGKLAFSLARSIVDGAIRAGSALKSFAMSALGSVTKLASILQGVGDSVLAIANRIVTPLTQAAEGMAKAGVAAAALATATGLSVQAITALGYAAEQSGASVEDVGNAVESMNKKLADASKGGKDATKAFTQLRLDVAKLMAMSPEDRFTTIGIAIASLADPLERAKAAQDAFGASNAGLVEMFARGNAGLAEMRQEAERLGLVMGEDQVAAAKELTAANKFLRDSLTGLWRTLGAAVAPQLAATAREMATVVRAITLWVRENQPLIAQVFRIASTIAGVATGLTAVASALALATPGVIALTAALGAGYLAWGKYGDSVQSALSGAMQVAQDFYAETTRVLGGVWDAIKGGDLELAVEIAWLGAKKAWAAGLMGLAEITGPALGGMLDALAAGDWKNAASQAWTAVQSVFEAGMVALDDLWTGLMNTVDQTFTSMKQMANQAMQTLADFALRAIKQVDTVAKAIAKFDPTGTLADARNSAVAAIGSSGLVRAAGAGNMQRENFTLAAELETRQRGRETVLAERQASRAGRIAGYEETLRGQQQVADNSARASLGETGGRLEMALRRASEAAAEADRKSAAEIERRNRLAAGAAAGPEGGGFGATFSGAALLAMAGGTSPAQDRTAKATEAAAKNTEKLVEIAKERGGAKPGGLVWQQ